MRATLRSALACSLALALGLPGSALGAPSKSKSSKGESAAKDPAGTGVEKDPGDPRVPPVTHEGPPRVGRVWVDADGISVGGAVLAGRAMNAGTGGLESQAVTITEAPAGPELQVTLKDRDSGGYRVDYVIVYDGTPIKNGTGGFDCQLCTEDELIEKVEALAIQVAPKLVVPEPEPGPGPGPGPDVGPKPDDGGGGDGGDGGTKTDGSDELTSDGLGGKGKAGIGLLVAGGLGAAAGVALLVIKPIPIDDDPSQATKAQDTKPLGGAILGVGVALLVTGGVLLGLDRKQAKAKRSKAAAMVHPWVGAEGAGVGVVGRF